MAASRDLPFPLVIVCLVLIRGSSPLPTVSGVADFTVNDADYEEFTTVLPTEGPTTTKMSFKRCDYDPCREDQIPCAKLKKSTGCFCPGITLYDEVPDTPRLRPVSRNGSEVVIQWCAPNSYVTGYIVTVGGQERRRFGKDQRKGGVGDIDHISEVCVAAVNEVGESKEACMMYQPTDNNMSLKAGLIGGALGFLLLVLLAVLLWRHKRQRKQRASIPMHDTAAAQ